jgi:hypothetical protein
MLVKKYFKKETKGRRLYRGSLKKGMGLNPQQESTPPSHPHSHPYMVLLSSLTRGWHLNN